MIDLERLAEQYVVVLNFKMKIASVALLMVSTFLAICSRVSLCNKRECQVWGMFSVTQFFILVFCPVHQASRKVRYECTADSCILHKYIIELTAVKLQAKSQS